MPAPIGLYLTEIKVNTASHLSRRSYFWLWIVVLVHSSLSTQFTWSPSVIISWPHRPITSKDYLKCGMFSNTVAAAGAWTPVTVSGWVQGEYWPPNNSRCRDSGDGQILNRLSDVDLWRNICAKCKNVMNLIYSRKN